MLDKKIMHRMKYWTKLMVFFLVINRGESAYASHLPDWLIYNLDWNVTVTEDTDSKTLSISNGLVTRSFLTSPGFTTTDLYCHQRQSSLLRALNPEAVVTIDGVLYNIGGVLTSVSRAYLNRTSLATNISPDPSSFQFHHYDVQDPIEPFPYSPRRGVPIDISWPPKGKQLSIYFRAPIGAPARHSELQIVVHYEVYSGIPVIVKWITIKANSAEAVKVSIKTVEELALNQQWASTSAGGYGWLHVLTNEPHGTVIAWSVDTENVEPGSFQPSLQFHYQYEFSMTLGPKQNKMESFHAMVLLVGTAELERLGLAHKRLTRILAPQTMEAPIYFHMTKNDSKSFRGIVDQLAEVGFDMVFYSFGSGFDLEGIVNDATRLEMLKADIVYANSRGVEVGGYDLICWTRQVKKDWMAITNDPKYNGACFASGWYDKLLQMILKINLVANLTAVETDGPYPGYRCSSKNHSYHVEMGDSVYQQNLLQGQFFSQLRERGIFINQPDNYFFQGGSKSGMGYNENQFSLPRWMDISVSRQGLFDDTFMKTPTEGWMFLPLVEYHGGGASATFEPLQDNIKEYDFALGQYFGAGIQACYRGYQIFDSEETKNMVKKWVSFYKKYRAILSGNLIHVRRPDMQSIDGFLHVPDFWYQKHNKSRDKGLAVFFNPTDYHISQKIGLPLYYTGLIKTALVLPEGDQSRAESYLLDRDYSIKLKLSMNPKTVTWLLIQ